jgi:hypothetical protein
MGGEERGVVWEMCVKYEVYRKEGEKVWNRTTRTTSLSLSLSLSLPLRPFRFF